MPPLRRPRKRPLRPGTGRRINPEVRHQIRPDHRVVKSGNQKLETRNRTCYPQVDMDQDQLRGLLEAVRSGAVDIDAAVDRMRHLPFEDLGYAKLDHHRALRHGLTEVIFGKGKTPEQIGAIAARLLDKSPNLLVTRADRHAASLLKADFPDANRKSTRLNSS